ncbi:TonB-dependent receptor [Sphingomonas swuensis]|uniref:TonB-dependent receptor n=1 Tax=Sphingomonas swuensis TaxID=977800 RepID=A0ABP7SHP7_9SPHN
MNIKTIALGTVGLAALAIATPAFAQAQQPVDPTVEAQTNPADPNDGAPQTDDAVANQEEGEAIVVTGLRRSLQSAQNIKRNSDQIVDAIVAEDIGKLPDVTASAALARITGVQVNRAAAEASDVQVRGLPDISTTYNGREIFTANDRFVAIQDFPAGSVGALEVFKSSTANLVEGGLGGQVNVRSRKPFDFQGFELSGSFNVVDFTQKDDKDWNGNILVSNRWKMGDGSEFGLLVNAAMTNIDFLDSTRESTQIFRDLGGGRFIPDINGLFYGSGNRYRPSANFAAEFRLNPDFRMYVDGLWQGYRGRDSNQWLLVPLFGDTAISNVVVGSDGRVDSVTGTGGNNPDGYYEFVKLNTNTYQFGGGFSADLGAVLWTTDIATTDSKVKRRQINVDYALASSPTRNVDFQVGGPGGPAFDFLNFDTLDPNNYRYRGLFLNNEERSGKDLQVRSDLEWDTGFANLPKAQFGVRFSNRKADFQGGSDYRGSPFRSFDDVPVELAERPCGFDYENYQAETCFLGPKYGNVFGNSLALARFAGFATDDIAYDPLRAYDAKEKSAAVYGQVRYEFDAGFPIDGLIGLRAVHTDSTVNGVRRTFPGDTRTPISVSNKYTDFLPNASMRLQFRRNLQARLAYTETRTRANFADLNPGSTLDAPTGACAISGPTSSQCFRTGGGGNPDLQPINSRNYDATIEYYFGRQGQLSAAIFRREIRNFIFGGVTDIPEGTTVNFIRYSSPVNGGKGKINGLELAATTFFDYDFLPRFARGFGVQANYTYIDASTELAPQYSNNFPGQQRFPGVSKHAANLIGLYEQGPLSARLAYNWRSKFVREYTDNFQGQAPVIQKSLGQLDFSASYTPFRNVTVAFDALNLLAGSQPIRTERYSPFAQQTFDFQTKYLERVYSLGIRFRY